jgi:hypothetical protein
MRTIVLLLCMVTIVSYGYALAGLGGYFFDKGRPDLIIIGLMAGTASAVAAILLWRRYLLDIEY